MLLFGSAARGSATKESDVDILVVTESDRPKKVNLGQIEIQILSLAEISRMENQGALFGLHLAREGKLIYGDDAAFETFKKSIHPRASYNTERRHSFDLANFLYAYGRDYDDHPLINKRIAWCVRTNLISRLVESGRFIFSPEGISENFPDQFIYELISLRRNDASHLKRFENLKTFLAKFNHLYPVISKDDYKKRFKRDKNYVASSTLALLEKGDLEERNY